jgi:hypothetical protein
MWFIHKASVYFHKMDNAVGNSEQNEMNLFCNDSSYGNESFDSNIYLIIKDNVSECFEKQEIIFEDNEVRDN